MKFIIERKNLLKPLQQVSSRLSGRNHLPILGNILVHVTEQYLFLTGTNLNIEILVRILITKVDELGITTVCARKFFDICRLLPESAQLSIKLENNIILISSGSSRFYLQTIAANNFPKISNWNSKVEFILQQKTLKHLMEATQFSMANQDVRYYLNGLLFETEGNKIRTVATDGYRISICTILVMNLVSLPYCSVILPRNSVIELLRIIDDNNNEVIFKIGSNNIKIYIGDYIITSKIIDGQFPNFNHIFTKKTNKTMQVSCKLLKQALTRVAILSHDKFHSVTFNMYNNKLKITTNNIEKEEAEEILDVLYQDEEFEISFNINYILDVLKVLQCNKVFFKFSDKISCVKIEDCINNMSVYFVMPIQL
ncbi:DNA polymerase III subunit beta [Candidatus Palibaumannia cicadellinicola]|uniref:Beta sliding clamp n=1 Tax=Candidatus Palibaumannia cicadellinicola TaxID=186490 RepID=A0A0K2BKL4_9GAMM|nr:DNA polymerase III subunit beta [Candidatus Baumannia cicadellinicola]AKZ65729.1 DNA polymerase III beta subunit [Candidatus Baumannia cicadellinicola]